MTNWYGWGPYGAPPPMTPVQYIPVPVPTPEPNNGKKGKFRFGRGRGRKSDRVAEIQEEIDELERMKKMFAGEKKDEKKKGFFESLGPVGTVMLMFLMTPFVTGIQIWLVALGINMLR